MSEILKPCPFCESENLVTDDNDDMEHLHFWIVCDDCDSRGPRRTSPEDAAAAWNRRAPTAKGEDDAQPR